MMLGVTVGFERESYSVSEQDGFATICVGVYSAGSNAQTRAVSVTLNTAPLNATGNNKAQLHNIFVTEVYYIL